MISGAGVENYMVAQPVIVARGELQHAPTAYIPSLDVAVMHTSQKPLSHP